MDFNSLISALAGKQWVLAGAIVVGCIVATAKQGWLGAFIAKKLPPASLPYLALGLGTLGVASAEVIAGKPLMQALIDGFVSGMSAIVGHETLIESLRKGKELIPSRLPSSAPPASPPAPPAPPPAKEAS